MYTPSHVANFMLERAEKDERGLSPMKLLKLVYIGYGWGLAVLDERLFDEPIYAWPHGPVIRSLYHEFKHFGGQAITGLSVDLDLDKGEFVVPRIPKKDEKINVVLGKVWDIYKHFSAWDLRNKTHEPNTPWSTVYKKGQKDIMIPAELISEHFNRKIRQYLENAKGHAAA